MFEPREPADWPADPAPQVTAELNGPQAQAVTHVDGPLLVFAGAGSGKTRVITYRIANLVACHRVPPYRVLAVTFTNKAAGEMRRRLGELCGDEIARDLWVGTFHAVCARLLRTFPEAAGLDRGFLIYDDSDQRSLMGRILKELDIDDRRYPVRQVLGRIHREKQEGRSSADFVPQSFVDDAIAKCFDAYERRLRAANAVDFDDLLLCVLRVAEDPESLPGQDLRRRFRHVLVDEFQDVNQVQYRLVRAFCGEHSNLCVVGDDDQSIYRWRGADVQIVRNFRRDYPSATVVKLEQNYRSVGHVVDAALAVIKPARDREPKELWTSNRAGEPVVVVAADNEHDEAAWVVERIAELVSEGVSPRDIAVFYRIHAQSRVLEEVMRIARLPYQIIGGTKFYERAEVKDLLSYLKVLSNPRSDVDLHRIINVPPRKIGPTTVAKLIEAADERRTCLHDALTPLVDGGALATAAKRSVIAFRDLLQTLLRDALELSPSELAERVLERTGYAKLLEEDESVEAESRLLNLRELVQSIADYEAEVEAEGLEPTLVGYLERVTLSSDIDSLEDAPKVAMMTVHAAKGLEYHAVFITGMEEDLFPFRSMDPSRGEDAEEERRLAYVAITRARERLAISHAARRQIFGQTRFGLPSRFLRDLPAASVRLAMTEAVRDSGRRLEPAREGRAPLAFRPGGGFVTRAPDAPRAPESRHAPGERYVEREAASESGGERSALRRGMRVRHERFGTGLVQGVDAGVDPIVTVDFPGWGKKRIKAAFLELPEG